MWVNTFCKIMKLSECVISSIGKPNMNSQKLNIAFDITLLIIFGNIALNHGDGSGKINNVMKETRKCQLPFVEVKNFCYFANFKKQTFVKHLADCKKRGGYLAMVKHAKESRALSVYLKSLNVDDDDWAFFIGLKDHFGDNRNYKWIPDGSKLKYSNWAKNNPHHNQQRCALVIAKPIYGGYRGEWDDIECHLPYGAICETH